MIEHFPSLGRSCEFRVSSTCSMLHCGRWLAESVCLSKPVLCDPKFVALSCQHLDSGKIKTSPSGNPLKCLPKLDVYFNLPLPYTARCKTWRLFSWPYSTEQGKVLVSDCHTFPIASDLAGLHSKWVQLLESIYWYLDFSQGIPLCIIESMSSWGTGRVWSLLVDINTLENSVSISTFRCVNCIWEVRGTFYRSSGLTGGAETKSRALIHKPWLSNHCEPTSPCTEMCKKQKHDYKNLFFFFFNGSNHITDGKEGNVWDFSSPPSWPKYPSLRLAPYQNYDNYRSIF